MMRFLAAALTACLCAFGFGGVVAATPEDCAESDTVPPDVECPIDGDNYPIVLPTSGTVPDSTTPVTTDSGGGSGPGQGTDGGTDNGTDSGNGSLPSTGPSTAVSTLQVGALLVAGGIIVLVAVRRRRPDATA